MPRTMTASLDGEEPSSALSHLRLMAVGWRAQTRCRLSAICQQNVRELDETSGNQTTPVDIIQV